jgi:VIT1/CCC1 family predicted Fe2+/Mn2+ transporter
MESTGTSVSDATIPSGSKRVLDPIERSSEVLFGLIMVLSFTCTISVVNAGVEDVRGVVIGAVGCNLAWGLDDAIMYLMAIQLERGRGLLIAREIRKTTDPVRGRQILERALPEPFDRLFDGPALEEARAKLVALPALPKGAHLKRRDWLGGLAVFLLVFLSTLPVVVPFLFVEPLPRAMRVSNGVAIGMLFVAGIGLGRWSGLGPWRTGFVMVALGLVLVGITIALGG